MNPFLHIANPGVEMLKVYEPGRPIEEVARELGFENASEIDKLASNENALGPSPMAIEAMRVAAGRMHRYPDGGAYYLKRKLAARLDVKPENLLVGNGSNELLEFLGHVFVRPGDAVVVSECAFVVYRLVTAMFGGETIAVPMRGLTHDLDAMAEAITPRTRLVFVANPNNPTGTMVDEVSIHEFMARVPEHVVVCFDEAYIDLLPPEKQCDVLSYVRDGRPVVVLRTFSKAYGLAGLRIGYAVAPEDCTALLNRVRQPFNVNAMALAAAEAALDDEDHLAATRALVASELPFFETALREMDVEFVPSVANFFLARVGEGRACFEALQRRGVIVRPMDGYGLADYVRITIGTRAENERCVAALKQVLRGDA